MEELVYDPRRGKLLFVGQLGRVFQTRNQLWFIEEDPLGNESIHPIAGWMDEMPKPLRQEWLGGYEWDLQGYDWERNGNYRVAIAGGRPWIGSDRRWDGRAEKLDLDSDLNWVWVEV